MGTSEFQTTRLIGMIFGFGSFCLIQKLPPSTTTPALQLSEPNWINSEGSKGPEMNFDSFIKTKTSNSGLPKSRATLPTSKSTYPYQSTDMIPETSTCGQVLDKTSKFIYYTTLFQPQLQPKERCVWIIQTNGAEGYIFPTHLSLGGDSLVISTLGRTTYDYDSLTNYQIARIYQPVYVSRDTQVVIITYYPNANPTSSDIRGFRLSYDSYWFYYPDPGNTSPVAGNTPPIAGNTSSFIISTPSQRLEYPPEGKEYTENELTTFLFMPSFEYNSAATTKHVHYSKETLDQQCVCCDRVDAYIFNTVDSVKGIKEWTYDKQICSDERQVTMSSQDMILLVFQSDGSNTGKGFNLKTSET